MICTAMVIWYCPTRMFFPIQVMHPMAAHTRLRLLPGALREQAQSQNPSNSYI